MALLRGSLAAALIALAVPTPAHASGLYDCGTRVNGSTGSGWCHGTGKFRLAVTCADGAVERSALIVIHEGFGTALSSCARSAAAGAAIEEVTSAIS